MSEKLRYRILTDGKVFRIKVKFLFWWLYVDGYSFIAEYKTEDEALAYIKEQEARRLKNRSDSWKIHGEM